MRIRRARNTHHLPIQPLRINVRRRWSLVCRLFRSITDLLVAGGSKVFGVVGAPSLLIAQIGFESAEEVCVKQDLPTFELLPSTITP